MIACGNEEAKRILDERYAIYAKRIVKDFIDAHSSLGFTFDDYENAVFMGYCKARDSFCYEISDGFYPYFKTWAICEMRRLNEEGLDFYMERNPSYFVSLDLPYNKDDESMILSEQIGFEDEALMGDLHYNEIVMKITDSSTGLTDQEAIVCSLLVLKFEKREIREFCGLSYKQLKAMIISIESKLSPYLKAMMQ